MVPESFETFFLAAAGAGGAFVGLLFVAISILPQRTFDPLAMAGVQHQRLAEATLLTLFTGFTVSSIALIPGINVGWITLVLGVIGVLTATHLGWRFAQLHRHGPSQQAPGRHLLRVISLSLVATVVYTIQCLLGLHLLLQPTDASPFRGLALTIIGLYALAIVRAWTLLGDPQYGWSGWLNPLQDLVPTGNMAVTQEAKPGPSFATLGQE
jgi:hypothetical protein